MPTARIVLCWCMTIPDLNQLVTLDVLLAECSVARAAQRLQLSPSAMSRALARLRETMGDPLLVRAGRGLVATPRAMAVQAEVRQLVQDAAMVLRPAELIDLAALERTFTLRTSDGFMERFGPPLIERVGREAPRVRLNFIRKLDKDSARLRDGTVDLETGVVDGHIGPEVRTMALFRDCYVGIVRPEHPMAQRAPTPAEFAAGRHILVSRNGIAGRPIDEALQALGLEREIITVVDGFATAVALVRGSDLIATVPERHTRSLCSGLSSFPLPWPMPDFVISLLWHPRQDADPAHRWLRGCTREVCAG